MRSEHVSVVVRCAPERVYTFARDVDNLPRWAAGLASSSVRREADGSLVAESPMGTVRFAFVPVNGLGVLDHDVELPNGEVVTNPMRVFPHPDGAEVLFTIRQLALSDDEFDRDVAMVRADLERLRGLLDPS